MGILLQSVLGWLLIATLIACFADRPVNSPVLPPITSGDTQALLEAIRAREERIRTLRARFTARTFSGDGKRTSNGVVLVKKPDKFRLRLTMPLGLTVFDYVSWGEHSQISLPLEDRIVDSPDEDAVAPLSRKDLGQAFLRGSDRFPGTCVPQGNGERPGAVVLCRDASGSLLRTIRIDTETGAVLEETTYDESELRMVLRFEDYRLVEEAYLPHRIALWYPRRLMTADISIERYAVNPNLADALFEPLVPWAGR